MELMSSYDFTVYEILENIDGYTISYCKDNVCNVCKTSGFVIQFDYFDSGVGSPFFLQEGLDKVIAYGTGTSYYLYSNGI